MPSPQVINLLVEMFHVCTSLLTIVVWENQNDLGQFRFPNTLTIMLKRAEMLSQNFPTARANAKGISRHMVILGVSVDAKRFFFQIIVGAEYIACTHCTHGSYAYGYIP